MNERVDRNYPQTMLVQQYEFAFSCKTKVCDATRYNDLSDQHASDIPNIDPVATATIHVAIGIALDAVWHA